MEPITAFFLALTTTSFSLMLLICVCLGWGFWMGKWLQFDPKPNVILQYLWLGFIGLSLAADITHLLVPINWILTALFAVIGVIGLANIPRSFLNNLYQHCSHLIKENKGLSIFLFGLYILWCMQMLSGEINYDAGMYYFSSIRWLNEYPIVPGLANLFAQFGFNHTYFSFVALLNTSPLANNHFALGGIFLLGLSTATLFGANLINKSFGWILTVVLFFGLHVSARLLASPAPDMVVGFIEIALFTYLIKVFLDDEPIQKKSIDVSLIFLLAIQVTTIKLSAALFALGCITLIAPNLYRHTKENFKWGLRLFMLGSLIFLIHIIRGYILSGYPLFPSTVLGLPQLDWIAATDDAQNAAKVIYDYARNEGLPPGQWKSGWEWLPYWWEQQLKNQGAWIVALLTLLSLNGLILVWRRKNYIDVRLLWLYLPIVGATIFWFFTAPAWRFLGVIPFLLLGLSSWFCVRAIFSTSTSENSLQRLKPWIFIPILISASVISLRPTGIYPSGWKPFPGIMIDKNPDHPVAEVIIENKLTDSGLNIVFVPWFQCWNAPLPCTPLFNPKLHLRSYSQEKSVLGSGFSVNRSGEELRPKYQGSLESGIQFNKTGYPNFLTSVTGMGAVEPWGRWTNGSVAQFKFLYPLPKKFELKIRLLAFGPNANRDTNIKVCEETKAITPSDRMESFMLTFTPQKPCSSLEIKVPFPISPKEINPLDSDTRTLGLGIEFLGIKD
jgi:hypothetical protein